ncbi:MAG: hypothetical protein ACRCY4_00085 [Brevinema sp.]
MNHTFLSVNNAEERFETVRPIHLEALKSMVKNFAHWDSDAVIIALDGFNWREKRIPLSVIELKREDLEKQYSPVPYDKPSYRFWSHEWKQELLMRILPKKARYTITYKKGMGLIDAVGNINHALRSIYTDLPILYTMDKIGVGIVIVADEDKCFIQQKLTETPPKTELPILIIAINR